MTVPFSGDIIVAVDGRAVRTASELRAYVENNKHPGDSVTITIVRNGQREDVVVMLAKRPPATAQPTTGG